MSDIYLDPRGVEEAMRRVVREAQGYKRAHDEVRPQLSSSAVGRGFGGYAQRLQSAFDKVHQRGIQRFDATEDLALAAIAQVRTVAEADGVTSAVVKQVGEEL